KAMRSPPSPTTRISARKGLGIPNKRNRAGCLAVTISTWVLSCQILSFTDAITILYTSVYELISIDLAPKHSLFSQIYCSTATNGTAGKLQILFILSPQNIKGLSERRSDRPVF